MLNTVLTPSSKTTSAPATRGVQGGIALTFATKEAGNTFVAKQYFRPPVHLSKPYFDGHYLTLHLMSPTAGLLEGDTVDYALTLDKNAQALISTPAATRVHTMLHGGTATVQQKFTVASGALLDFFPEPLILQKQSSLTQTTHIEVEPGGEVIYSESIAPGRVARGESFEFTQCHTRLKIYSGDTLIARENNWIKPESNSVASWRSIFKDAYYTGIFVITEKDLQPHLEKFHALQTEAAWIGASPLWRQGIAIKILAQDGSALRKTLQQTRSLIYKLLEKPEALIRKI